MMKDPDCIGSKFVKESIEFREKNHTQVVIDKASESESKSKSKYLENNQNINPQMNKIQNSKEKNFNDFCVENIEIKNVIASDVELNRNSIL